MDNKRKVSIKSNVILGALLIIAITLVSAIGVIDVNNPADATVTENKTQILNFNITTDNLANVTFNFNGTNFSIFDENLVLAYNFNNLSALGENDTHVFDISGNGGNLTISKLGNVSMNMTGGKSNGNYGGAFEGTGVHGYGNIGDGGVIGNITDELTISAWIKYNDPSGTSGGYEVIVAKAWFEVYGLIATNDNSINFYVTNESGDSDRIVMSYAYHYTVFLL